MNPVLETIHRRRSLRAFADKNIAPEIREQILQATLRSPTAGNMMLYSIIDVEDQSLKDTLAQTCDHQPFIAKAPWALIFLADCQRWQDYFQHCEVPAFCARENRPLHTPQEGNLMLACCDALIAAQTAVLAAESLGIGSCYIGDMMENYETHRELLKLPRYVFPITMVCFGYPREAAPAAAPTLRFSSEFVVHKNTYRSLTPDEFEVMYQPLQQRLFADHAYLPGASNIGQHYYLKKIAVDFSLEMNRSVRAMLKNWQEP